MSASGVPPYIRIANDENDFDNSFLENEHLLSSHNVRHPPENRDSELLQLDGEDDYDTDDQLLVLERQLQQEEDDANRGCITVVRDAYGTFLVQYPHRYFPGSAVIVIILVILCVVAGIYSYRYHPPQEFIRAMQHNAIEGFEPRGTQIRKGQLTLSKLYYEVTAGKRYSLFPNVSLASTKLNADPKLKKWLENISRKRENNAMDPFNYCLHPRSKQEVDTTKNIGATSSYANYRMTKNPVDAFKYNPITNASNFLVFAFESEDPSKDLYNNQSMKTLCDMEKQIIMPMFDQNHITGVQVYSLTRIIADYYQKDDCSYLNQYDISKFKSFLRQCLQCYSESTADTISENAQHCETSVNNSTRSKSIIPTECLGYKEMILDIKEYFVDKQFTNLTVEKGALRYTTIHVNTGVDLGVEFYDKYIENQKYKKNGVVLSGIKFQEEQVKWVLFEDYFIKDTLWLTLAIGLVFLVMFIYQMRIDLAITTIVCQVFGFIFAYSIYYFILKMKFFPFMNLLVLLVLMAVGAGNVFVFFDIFKQIKAANPELSLDRIISKTIGQALVSVFATSLTTSMAFFANAVSNITAIKVFSIFTGVAVLVNFLIIVLMIPAVIVLSEVTTNPCKQILERRSSTLYTIICCRYHNSFITTFASNVYDEYFPKLIDKGWIVFITVLGILGIGSGIVVFASPRFRLPVSEDFQVFPTSNLIERWYLDIKNHFYFTAHEHKSDIVSIYYIWGFKGQDVGNHWDPKDIRQPLLEEPSFNFYDPETQQWLTKFCKKITKAPYMPNNFVNNVHCNFNVYNMVAKYICSNSSFSKTGLSKCCVDSDLPFSSEQLELCLPIYQTLFDGFNFDLNTNITGNIFGKVIYNVHTNKVHGFVLQLQTVWPWSSSYNQMNYYYDILTSGFLKELATAPEGIKKGFLGFNESFSLYDLQHSLATGTYKSIGVSVGVVFLVMLFTSLNMLVTIYAILSTTLAILCTLACLVFMQWHLNIIETLMLSISVGLSMNFTIHYGLAYQFSEQKKPNLRMKDSFNKVGPAVAMAALATFISGASVMPCRVLPYTKLGTFLMLLMIFSWIYATFLFQSLCRIIGPRGNFCQISALCNRRKVSNIETSQSHSQEDLTLRRVDSDDSLLVGF